MPVRKSTSRVSVLFNESKLLKCRRCRIRSRADDGFSTLQRVEIAEIETAPGATSVTFSRFSTLQRVEIAEIHVDVQMFDC